MFAIAFETEKYTKEFICAPMMRQKDESIVIERNIAYFSNVRLFAGALFQQSKYPVEDILSVRYPPTLDILSKVYKGWWMPEYTKSIILNFFLNNAILDKNTFNDANKLWYLWDSIRTNETLVDLISKLNTEYLSDFEHVLLVDSQPPDSKQFVNIIGLPPYGLKSDTNALIYALIFKNKQEMLMWKIKNNYSTKLYSAAIEK